MPVATINGVEFRFTVDEFSALVGSVDQCSCDHADSIRKLTEKAQPTRPTNNSQKSAPSNSSSEHAYECGHVGPKKRGRYSALCDECKSQVDAMTENADEDRESSAPSDFSETPKSNRTYSRKRYFPQREETPLDELPDDKPASDKQRERTRNMANRKLDEKAISASAAKKAISLADNPAASVQAVARIYRALRSK